ncbi:hypothetical protein [Polyangium mundeleinium]|uniref:Lipoprotein n=1 Tax=Polyangium mundeleinium TaxID=2995306 RepID=A0ABT5EZ21_9BACT|nr:hypothetical protein [Polyangium mundeleinium]MDC0746051.1 hypothetical protein [Polyangium mundeleinium]
MQALTRRRSAMLGVLVLGFGGAWMTGACGSSEPSESGCPAPGVEPPVEQPTDCAMPVEDPCKRYYLPLLGNPSDDIELQRKYKTAFGSACYVAADANATFNCFYEEKQLKVKKNGEDGKACADAKMIAEIFGAAPYSKNYKCVKDSGTDDYSLQVGPDPAIKIYIKLGDAPLETSLIEINGMPTEVNGPYRNLVEPSNVGPGKDFHCEKIDNIEQRVRILQVNRKAHGGKIHSDLAGFTYPCGVDENCKPKICTEPDILKDPESTPNQYDPRARRGAPRGAQEGQAPMPVGHELEQERGGHLGQAQQASNEQLPVVGRGEAEQPGAGVHAMTPQAHRFSQRLDAETDVA